jgi:hypothetical protein
MRAKQAAPANNPWRCFGSAALSPKVIDFRVADRVADRWVVRGSRLLGTCFGCTCDITQSRGSLQTHAKAAPLQSFSLRLKLRVDQLPSSPENSVMAGFGNAVKFDPI